MTYKVLIIDDEPPAREIIKYYLASFPELEVIGEEEDGFSGLKTIRERKPDLVFLDVQMPRLTGFEMLELLEDPPIIIFSTAYDQFALKAFEMSATDYLLKPYSAERFATAVRKALDRLGSGKTSSVGTLATALEEQHEFLQRIAVKSKHNVHVIPVNDILYMEAEGDYVMIHLAENRYLKEKTMKYFETHMDPVQFVRIHRSFIVNVNYIARLELYDKEQYSVRLKNGAVLKASSTGYKLLKDLLKL